MLKSMLAASAAASLLALGACGQTTTVDADDSSAEQAAQSLENAADRAGDNIEHAADQAGDNIEQAGDNAADAVNDATDGDPNSNP